MPNLYEHLKKIFVYLGVTPFNLVEVYCSNRGLKAIEYLLDCGVTSQKVLVLGNLPEGVVFISNGVTVF
jgi:hypothetical protein